MTTTATPTNHMLVKVGSRPGLLPGAPTVLTCACGRTYPAVYLTAARLHSPSYELHARTERVLAGGG